MMTLKNNLTVADRTAKEQAREAGAFLREVDEALHQERLEELGRKWGLHIAVAVAAIVLAVVGYRMYNDRQAADLMRQGNEWAEALKAPAAEQGKLFDALRATGSPGFRMVAGFKQGQDLAAAGKSKEAAAVFATLADDKGLDVIYRDLARFQAGMSLMEADPKAAGEYFTALDRPDSAYKASAMEMLAALAENRGDRAGAVEFYERALEDAPEANSTITFRIKEHLDRLKAESGIKGL